MLSPTVVDLFSGCGGISWGLQEAGFCILAGVDLWRPALRTFQLNHPHSRVFEADLTKLAPQQLLQDLGLGEGELDCLVGGPPCQGFSKNVPATERFLEDPRNLLFRNFLDFVKVLAPKTVLIENVAELYNAFSGQIREEIQSGLSSLGYEVQIAVIYAPEYGVPQRRRRCFFIASRTGVKPELPPATFGSADIKNLKPFLSAWSAISDLPILYNGEGYEPMEYVSLPGNDYQTHMRRTSIALYDHVTRTLNAKQYARISSIKPGQGLRDLPPPLQTKGGYSGAYGRLDFEMMAPTITRWVFHPGSGRFCHPQQPRLLTIREVARLQSFPDTFRFTGTYIEKAHQVGNAVPPHISYAFATSLRDCLAAEVIAEPPQEVVI